MSLITYKWKNELRQEYSGRYQDNQLLTDPDPTNENYEATCNITTLLGKASTDFCIYKSCLVTTKEMYKCSHR